MMMPGWLSQSMTPAGGIGTKRGACCGACCLKCCNMVSALCRCPGARGCRCPSARGITITKARLSKNAPRRRYVLMVVGCLFILDCSFYFFVYFFLTFPVKPFFCLQPWGEQCLW